MSACKGLCHKCKVILTIENCGSSRFLKYGSSAYCRVCDKDRLGQYAKENKEKISKQHKEYRAKDPIKWKEYGRQQALKFYHSLPEEERKARRKRRDTLEWRNRQRKYLYGIEPEEFEGMLISQDYKCAICFGTLVFDSKIRNEKPIVDHDHKTNEIRELLCSKCNSCIGLAQDSIEILASAIRYLQKHSNDSSIQIDSNANGTI